ncbi:hypothetical protein J2S02_002976 [Metabacillus niabensis]|uniref:Uncharacterized protein n=1 Tax=Metabacillus niabensis TaxID=324854 RepID=A0ABT9Z2Z1_9BACI|nr:hypothetical protein [Metabacillus niabensis]
MKKVLFLFITFFLVLGILASGSNETANNREG